MLASLICDHITLINFNFKYVKCTIFGYSPCYKGYKCLDYSGKLYISRSVLVDEFSFPFQSLPLSTTVPTPDYSSLLFSLLLVFLWFHLLLLSLQIDYHNGILLLLTLLLLLLMITGFWSYLQQIIADNTLMQ